MVELEPLIRILGSSPPQAVRFGRRLAGGDHAAGAGDALLRRLGAGNGALFQLVPLRWPLATAVAGSMIGEIGALGGGLVPSTMGLSKQYAGSYMWGFFVFAALALIMLTMLRVMQIRWTRTWAEKGGRARSA